MPSRNSLKEFAPEQYHHVYNRGVDKRVIFKDDNDYKVFLGLIQKYLTGQVNRTTTSNRHKYEYLGKDLDLLAYCLLPNHIHLLLYQRTGEAITKFMRRLMTGYSMYFNKRYSRSGHLFEGCYKASHVNEDGYLHHISRYIHMNPKEYMTWPYSSLTYYAGREKTPAWLQTEAVLGLFNDDQEQYLEFIRDYHDSKAELSVLKWQLANDPEDSD